MTRACICCKFRMSKASSDLSLFGFPRSDELLKRWLVVIGMEKKVTGSSRICSRHFKEEDFRYSVIGGKRYLKQDAIPSLYLVKDSKDDAVSINQDIIVKENQPTNTMTEYMKNKTNSLDIMESCIEVKGKDKLSERILLAPVGLSEPKKKPKKYLYDVRWEEISTSSVQAKIYWEVAIKKITRQKLILKTLRQKLRRLKKQILDLQTLVKDKAITDNL